MYRVASGIDLGSRMQPSRDVVTGWVKMNREAHLLSTVVAHLSTHSDPLVCFECRSSMLVNRKLCHHCPNSKRHRIARSTAVHYTPRRPVGEGGYDALDLLKRR